MNLAHSASSSSLNSTAASHLNRPAKSGSLLRCRKKRSTRHSRWFLVSAAAFAATSAFSGCGMVGSMGAQHYEVATAPDPIQVKAGDAAVIELGPSHPSVGSGYSIVKDPDSSILSATINHESDAFFPAPGGDRGESTLYLHGEKPGTQKIRVVGCFRDVLDEQGNCDQESLSDQQKIDKEFTVEVTQ